MSDAGRVSWTAMVGFGAPCIAFGASVSLMFYGPYPPGWTILAILMSAITWWLSALAALAAA